MNRTDDERVWDAEELLSPHTRLDKADRVRRMFDAIAPTYELVNSLFSAGRDRAWRRRAVSFANPTSSDRVLDIACGTGDFARAFRLPQGGAIRPRVIVGCDFAARMLRLAKERSPCEMEWVQADALVLPFRTASFTITGCAFGVRNFQDLDAGFREMHRVLAPGGRAVILEFSRPQNPLWRRMYEFYATRIMPLGATLVSRDRTGAYRYLPRSVLSFPDPSEMRVRLGQAGFVRVDVHSMTLGIVTIFVAVKGGDERPTL